MSFFLFGPFPDFTSDELNRRQTDRSYFLQPKSPWMRMVSNYGDGRILMGGDVGIDEQIRFGFRDTYNFESDTGELLRPQPTIQSVTSNEEGQFIRCTVNWQVNSLEQLDRLFPYFLNPGVTMLVDWGWSTMPAGAQVDASNVDELRSLYSSLSILGDTNGDEPQELYDHPRFRVLRRARGLYSYVVGTVVDFSIDMQENNQFSCTTEVQAVSETALHISYHSQMQRRKNVKNKDDIKPTLKEYMQENLDTLTEDPEFTEEIISFDFTDGNFWSGQRFNASYISWLGVERLINEFTTFRKNDNSNVATFSMDSRDTLVSYEEGLLSMNPAVFLLFPDPASAQTVSSQKEGSARPINKKPPLTTLSNDFLYNEQGEIVKGYLYNIYVNLALVKDAFTQHDDVFKAISYILKRISQAAPLSAWDYRIFPQENGTSVVDMSCPRDKNVQTLLEESREQANEFSKERPFVFYPNTKDTIVRTSSFNTNFAQHVQGSIMVGKFVDNSEVGSDQDAAYNTPQDGSMRLFKAEFPEDDRILSSMVRPARERRVRNAQEDMTVEWPGSFTTQEVERTRFGFRAGDRNIGFGEFSEIVANNLGEKAENTLFYRPDTLDKNREEALLKFMNNEGEDSMNNANMPIDIEASITLDGIGGLYKFQVFHIANVPNLFQSNGVFFVNSVDHSVSDTDWTTTVNAQFVVGNMYAKTKSVDGPTLSNVGSRRSVEQNIVLSDIEATSKKGFAISYVLANEGGLVNDPADPGGLTNFGISQRSFPDVDIANLTEGEARDIYEESFWDPYPYDDIESTEIATKIFDTHVNTGRRQSHLITQRSLNDMGFDVSENGLMDQQTVNALNEVTETGRENEFNQNFIDRQSRFYESLGNDRFLSGWLNRARKIPASNIS